MKKVIAEIITIGDEILIGQTVDTNSAWIARELNLVGIKIGRIMSIQDNTEEILSALASAEQRADIILITGGLGPTKDDITKGALCKYFNTKLIQNIDVLEDVKKMILPKYGKLNDLNIKQAEVPESARIIRNPMGTAPILWFEKDATVFVSMPGVPHEMKNIMEIRVLHDLAERFQTPEIIHKNVLLTGIGESFLAEKIHDWEESLPDYISLAYLPSAGILKLRLSAYGMEPIILKNEIDRYIQELLKIVPDYVFGFDDEKLEEIIGRFLKSKNVSLSSAESCTGGYIAHQITSIAGSSDYYKGSVIAYSNEIKKSVLNVKEESLIAYGAVSEQVVFEMAEGVKKLCNTDYAIATSGIAGPGGGTKEKPVGTVCIAISSPEHTYAKKYNFGDNRERNIRRATLMALDLLRKELITNP